MVTAPPFFLKVATTNPGSSLAFHVMAGTVTSRVPSGWVRSQN